MRDPTTYCGTPKVWWGGPARLMHSRTIFATVLPQCLVFTELSLVSADERRQHLGNNEAYRPNWRDQVGHRARHRIALGQFEGIEQ
jgi:hypothetical protein